MFKQKYYEQRLTLRLQHSSQRVTLLCKGEGLEPRIEFRIPNNESIVKFGPILPYSSGNEQEVAIVNPCKFPIEIYNLEFDKAYLEEEKVFFSFCFMHINVFFFMHYWDHFFSL